MIHSGWECPYSSDDSYPFNVLEQSLERHVAVRFRVNPIHVRVHCSHLLRGGWYLCCFLSGSLPFHGPCWHRRCIGRCQIEWDSEV